jgi:hypothetical protein
MAQIVRNGELYSRAQAAEGTTRSNKKLQPVFRKYLGPRLGPTLPVA